MALLDRMLTRLGLDFGGISLRSEARSPITPHLVVGARPRADELEALEAEGITHAERAKAR